MSTEPEFEYRNIGFDYMAPFRYIGLKPKVDRTLLNPISAAVVARRNALGITQSEVSRLSGISQPTISDIEAGSKPRVRTLEKVAKALECDPVELDPSYALGGRLERKSRVGPRSEPDVDQPLRAALDEIGGQMEKDLGFVPTHLQVVQFLAKRAGFTVP
jgi:transcriptional regulator with XRE-family HTH domain